MRRGFSSMELVEGETLEERLRRGRLDATEAIELFRQIALALEAAHAKGIVHRDLKPANIKITSEGTIKVLDFGLAKSFTAGDERSEESSQSPTLTKGTALGAILGTAPYMSPEQARGKSVDRATDIWAFGCCLFEALAGAHPFRAATVTDTIAAIVTSEPDFEVLPATVPRGVRDVLRRTLRKDRRRRLRDIADARLELEDAAAEPEPLPHSEVKARGLPLLSWIVAAAALALAIFLLVREAPTELVPARTLAIPVPTGVRVNVLRGGVAASPDGETVVFAGYTGDGMRLYLRLLNRMVASPIAGTEGGYAPFFSPDGLWVGFFADRHIKKVPLAGGSAVTVCELRTVTFGAVWPTMETILIANEGLKRVPAAGGAPEMLSDAPVRFIKMLPNGREVLATLWKGTVETSAVVTLSLETGETKTIVESATAPAYLGTTGHLPVARPSALFAAPFDLETLELAGPLAAVVDDLQVNSGGTGIYGLSTAGTLVYLPAAAPSRSLMLVDRAGNAREILRELRGYEEPKFSPEGGTLAYAIRNEAASYDLWTLDLARAVPSRVASSGYAPVFLWTRDGRALIHAVGGRTYEVAADGSAEARVLVDAAAVLTSSSPDGEVLVFSDTRVDTAGDILTLEPGGTGEATYLLETPANEGRGKRVRRLRRRRSLRASLFAVGRPRSDLA